MTLAVDAGTLLVSVIQLKLFKEGQMHIQVINFQLKGMSAAEFHTLCDTLAPQWAAIPGLISKVWLTNEQTNTFGGVYTWENRAAMENYLQSDLFNAVVSNPSFVNPSTTDFGVIEGPTRVTRGLVASVV